MKRILQHSLRQPHHCTIRAALSLGGGSGKMKLKVKDDPSTLVTRVGDSYPSVMEKYPFPNTRPSKLEEPIFPSEKGIIPPESLPKAYDTRTRYRGKCIRFFSPRGFGFVQRLDDPNCDYFCHQNYLKCKEGVFRGLRAGQEIEFCIADVGGKPAAVDVTGPNRALLPGIQMTWGIMVADTEESAHRSKVDGLKWSRHRKSVDSYLDV